jgi:hypothetical protein
VISIKSAGSWRGKSEFLKFFLLLLWQGLNSKDVADISLFFGANTQVRPIVEGQKGSG